MSITQTIYTPTTYSIKRKNSKDQLAMCALNIFHKIDECKDLDFKKRVLEDLFLVL